MSTYLQRRLVFHGAMVVLLGMLCGIPLSMVLLGYISGNPEDWKLAHMEGLLNGILVLAVAGISGFLRLSDRQYKLLVSMLALMAYGNALYGWVRGVYGVKGLDFSPPVANQVAALLGGLPVVFAFVAVGLVILGAYKKTEL